MPSRPTKRRMGAVQNCGWGLLEVQSRELEAASAHLLQVLDREPSHAPALTALGKVDFEQKDYTEAIPFLQDRGSQSSGVLVFSLGDLKGSPAGWL